MAARPPGSARRDTDWPRIPVERTGVHERPSSRERTYGFGKSAPPFRLAFQQAPSKRPSDNSTTQDSAPPECASAKRIIGCAFQFAPWSSLHKAMTHERSTFRLGSNVL